MCSHAYANKEEGARGHALPLSLRMGISCGWGVGGESKLNAGP